MRLLETDLRERKVHFLEQQIQTMEAKMEMAEEDGLETCYKVAERGSGTSETHLYYPISSYFFWGCC